MWWILYGYYVMFMHGGQNSWFCKASLIRIYYVSLFECKGPGMLKTIIKCMWGTEDCKTSTMCSVVKLSWYFCV